MVVVGVGVCELLSPTVCDPMDCSPPGSSVHGTLQARILEWVAISLGIFLTQEPNLGLLHCRQILYYLSHQGSCVYVCVYVCVCVCVYVCTLNCSVVSNSLQPYGLKPTRFLCPWGFFRQEYWTELPFTPPRDLPDPGIKPASLSLLHWRADSLPLTTWEASIVVIVIVFIIFIEVLQQ